MNRILVIGSQGQVGWELCRSLSLLGKVIAVDRSLLDLNDPSAIERVVNEAKPDAIVNAAAYTAVDKAETEQDLAFSINARAPEILARLAKERNALLLHYSTDYVFDGTKDEAYREEDLPNPQNIYGKSKLAGEQSVQEMGGIFFILRTSWVYSNRGKNFLLTMLRLGKERDELKIVQDQLGAPTWCRTIADASAHLVHLWLSQPEKAHAKKGLYHLTSKGQTSWYGFAETIFEEIERRGETKTPKLTGIPSTQYPLPAKRPLNSALSLDKLEETFQLEMPNWKDALKLCLDDL